jgi:tetratricopeptide (TPR) repeat protein
VADEDLPGVARICRFAGGFPLGIELAAAWVRLLSTREIAAALDEGSEPTATGRAVPVRQRSLRAAFEHSWGLLSGRERAVLSLLSIFRGSFGLAAGSAVGAATLPDLTELADRSLLRRAGPAYFEVPEVLRRYAEEKLREHPAEHARAVKRQTVYHLGLLADAEAGLASIDEHVAAARLQPEIDHIRAAWKRAAADRAHALLADAARGYFLFLDLLGWCEEGYAAFAEAADALAGDPAAVAAARECELYRGVFALRLGHLAEAEARLSRVLADFERLGEEARAAFAGHRLGTTLLELGRVDEAQEMYERSMRRYRALGDHRAAANSLTHLGNIAYNQGRLDDARRLHEEGIAIQRRIGDRRLLALSLNNLGSVLTVQGRHEEAERRYHEGLRLAASTRDPGSSVRLLHNLAYIGRAVGDLSAAAAFAERSLELSRRMGFRLVQAATLVLLGGITQDAGDHAGAEERYRAAMALLDGSGAAPLLLDATVSLAELEQARGNVEKARVLAAEALESPAVQPEARARAASLIQSLA